MGPRGVELSRKARPGRILSAPWSSQRCRALITPRWVSLRAHPSLLPPLCAPGLVWRARLSSLLRLQSPTLPVLLLLSAHTGTFTSSFPSSFPLSRSFSHAHTQRLQLCTVQPSSAQPPHHHHLQQIPVCNSCQLTRTSCPAHMHARLTIPFFNSAARVAHTSHQSLQDQKSCK